jgi:hypothetical protein
VVTLAIATPILAIIAAKQEVFWIAIIDYKFAGVVCYAEKPDRSFA